jgi:hypothetical protein
LLKRILSGDEVAKMNGVEAAPKKTDLHKRHGCRIRCGPQGRFRQLHNPIDVGPSSVKIKSKPRPRGGIVDTRVLKSVNPAFSIQVQNHAILFFSNLL